MSGATLRCLKSFFIFEEGLSYYCFAAEGDDLFIWHAEGYCGVNQIRIKRSSIGEYFKII